MLVVVQDAMGGSSTVASDVVVGYGIGLGRARVWGADATDLILKLQEQRSQCCEVHVRLTPVGSVEKARLPLKLPCAPEGGKVQLNR